MDISIHDLAAVCSADCLLSTELVQKVDQLTHFFGSAFDTGKVSLCNEAWSLISTSLRFWENTSLLLTQSQFDQTKLQVLILIHKRIRSNWYFQDPDIRKNIKTYMCTQSQLYNAIEMTKTRQSYFRKINQIIVQILKYQWMAEWINFLPQICQAIYANDRLAQNYFDLLSVIFQEIFSEQEKLTSEEMKTMKQKILDNYLDIQKIFQKYLLKEYGVGILKNCLQALNNLVLWVPPYYVFYGQITDKLIDVLQNTPLKLEVLSCLESIITLPYDDMVEGFLGKVYKKKIQIISYILSNKTFEGNKQIGLKILNTTLKFLEQQKKDIQKYGEKCILMDSRTIKQNKGILQKLLQWMGNCVEENEIIDMYKYITAITNKQSMPNIVQALVNVTPCPIDTTFYNDENIIKIQNIDSAEYAQDRKNYIQAIRNIVNAEQQGYFSLLQQYLEQNFSTLVSLKQLCKLIWNFYYFVEVAPLTSIKQKVFTVLNRLISIQDEAQMNIKTNKSVGLSTKKMYVTKLGIILIIGHKKCRKSRAFNQPYYLYVSKNINETNRFIKAIIACVTDNYDLFNINDKNALNSVYLHTMSEREGRLEVDLRYIQMIGKWVNQRQQNLKVGLNMILPILLVYKKILLENYNCNINGHQDVNQAKIKIFRASLKQLQVLSLAIPYFKSQIIFETLQQINIIKETIALYDLTGVQIDSVRYYQLASNVFSMLFCELTEQQINKNLDILFNQAGQISCFILQALSKKNLNQQVAGAMLQYLGKFIFKMADWQIQEQRKLALIHRIISNVYSCAYTHDQFGFTKFIQYVIKCKKLPFMESAIIQKTLLQVFVLATLEDENKTIQAIQIFKCILNDSIDSNKSQEMLYTYILELCSHIYLLIINLKSSLEFVKEYSDVFFMALVFIRNLKMKFSPEQILDNLTELKNILMSVTKKIYNHYSQMFLQKIQNFLGMIITMTNKQQFSLKIKDLIIVLRRGY